MRILVILEIWVMILEKYSGKLTKEHKTVMLFLQLLVNSNYRVINDTLLTYQFRCVKKV
jgi:hypothetical protein